MSGDSAHVGYLTPTPASPIALEDGALDKFLHDLFVGLTALDGKLVRPEYQIEPPTQPDRGSDWLAYVVLRMAADVYAAQLHDPDGDGADWLLRHETVEVLISAYGPNAGRTMALLRDGLQIEQNRAVLTANGMGLVETGEIINAPILAKDAYLRRLDMSMTFRREIRRTYTVFNLLSGQATLDTEAIKESIEVVGP